VARTVGRRRVQTVTTWTAAGSIVAAALLSAALGHGTAAARSSETTQNTVHGDSDGGTVGGDQLQPPQYVPGVTGDGGPHGASGGS
jgi:hypothetical protein